TSPRGSGRRDRARAPGRRIDNAPTMPLRPLLVQTHFANSILDGTLSLACLVGTGASFAQEGKQGGGLEDAIPFQLGADPGPVVGERIGARAMLAGLAQLTGMLALPLVEAGRAHTHAGAGSSLLLGLAFGSLTHEESYLRIGLHGALLLGRHATRHARKAA